MTEEKSEYQAIYVFPNKEFPVREYVTWHLTLPEDLGFSKSMIIFTSEDMKYVYHVPARTLLHVRFECFKLPFNYVFYTVEVLSSFPLGKLVR